MNKNKLSANQLLLVALAICGGYAYLVFNSKESPEQRKPEITAAAADAITRRCAVEAGIDPDAKGHVMTSEELRIMTACAERHVRK